MNGLGKGTVIGFDSHMWGANDHKVALDSGGAPRCAPLPGERASHLLTPVQTLKTVITVPLAARFLKLKDIGYQIIQSEPAEAGSDWTPFSSCLVFAYGSLSTPFGLLSSGKVKVTVECSAFSCVVKADKIEPGALPASKHIGRASRDIQQCDSTNVDCVLVAQLRSPAKLDSPSHSRTRT